MHYFARKKDEQYGDPAAQTFAREWNQLKYDFDDYMGEVSDSNRFELQALWDEHTQFEDRLRQLPQIVMPHYPKPPKAPDEEAPAKPSDFVPRGAHEGGGSSKDPGSTTTGE